MRSWIAGVVVGACVVGAVPGWGSEARVPVRAVGAQVGVVSPEVGWAVDVALARRGMAVRRGDLKGYLAGVAPELRATEVRVFGNLRALGAEVSYRRRELVDGAYRVSMRYQLPGRAWAATDVGYTFRIGAVGAVLVDTRRLDERVRGGRQPWDFGEIEVVRRYGVVVVVDRGERAAGERVARMSAQAVGVVKRVWARPLQEVPVIVAMRETRVLTELPSMPPGEERVRVQPMKGPEEDGRPVGGWVVVPPEVRLPELVHGMLHLVPVKMGDDAPRWLVEGLAEYAVKLTQPPGVVERERVRVGRLVAGTLTELPPDAAFDRAPGPHPGPASDRTGGVYAGSGIATTRGTNGRAVTMREVSWLVVDKFVEVVGVSPVTQYYLQVARRGYDRFARERLMREYTGLRESDLVEALRTPAA